MCLFDPTSLKTKQEGQKAAFYVGTLKVTFVLLAVLLRQVVLSLGGPWQMSRHSWSLWGRLRAPARQSQPVWELTTKPSKAPERGNESGRNVLLTLRMYARRCNLQAAGVAWSRLPRLVESLEPVCQIRVSRNLLWSWQRGESCSRTHVTSNAGARRAISRQTFQGFQEQRAECVFHCSVPGLFATGSCPV